MATPLRNILLGFVDEEITDKYEEQLNFSINKIGGLPVSTFYLK